MNYKFKQIVYDQIASINSIDNYSLILEQARIGKMIHKRKKRKLV